ncbi:hypothetical protein BG011_000842 [Mortierella polycephala]|uniref:Uncharacterized protein n=1 Tax=Mortierella polycephala TaxID=41804 RepID=A0A9P6QGP8_9FUNG|nr:hypothetical protein BG011_000842 [Mortierella polycephala]
MPNDGSLVPLPMSPCTDGSLGFDSEFLMTTHLRSVEDLPTAATIERVVATCISNEAKDTEDDSLDIHTDKSEDVAIEDEDDEDDGDYDEDEVIEEHEVLRETEDNVMKNFQDNTMKDHQGDVEALADHATTLTVSSPSDDVEDTCAIVESQSTTVENSSSSELDTITNPAADTEADTGTDAEAVGACTPEKMASGTPQRPAVSGMATNVQERGLTAASLALKKQQAVESATAALKAIAVEIPETDSISNRIKMFGGASPNRAPGRSKKFNVRDIVQKYNDVEDKRVAEEITHVERGHQSMEPRGVCSAYALSTPTRTALRPIPRRKMSHELNENETREAIVKGAVVGGMVVNGRSRYEDDRMGINQESVQSVKNAKSIFESMARC